MTIIEKYRDWKRIRGLLSPVNLGERDLVGGGAGVAVEVDVPAEVEGGGEHHHARVVHPLPVLPLPAGQVGQASLLSEKDDIYHVLLDILGQVAEMIANLNTALININISSISSTLLVAGGKHKDVRGQILESRRGNIF